MAADLLVLRDALGRMGSAFERFSAAVLEMQRLAERMEQAAHRERETRADEEVPRFGGVPPRAD
jgi:hypothetical protein